MRGSLLTPTLVLALATALPSSAAPVSPGCAWSSPLINPRLPVGRLRTLPAAMVCPPPAPAPAERQPTSAEPPVTVIMVHEIIVRPSQVIIEPPEVHFVDPPGAAPAEAPPQTSSASSDA
jgi:hypothetical protein